MTESAMWRAIRKKWWGHGVRVEASMGDAESGTPDTNLSVHGRGGWIELKVWPEELRVSQIVWHADALSRGATVVVLAQVSRGRYWIGPWHEYEKLDKRPQGMTLDQVLIDFEQRLGKGWT